MRPVLSLLATLAIVGCRPADAHPVPVASTALGLAEPVQQGKAAPAAKAIPDPRPTRADLARIDGKPNAKLWILIVSDFQCPYCKEYHDKTGKQVHKEFVETGIARVAYINYPLKIHRNALPASEAAMCAGAQDKFWPFHDKLFATVAKWGTSIDPTGTYIMLASELKLNLDVFRKCLADDVMLPMIDADYKRGTQAGATSTPTFLIGKIMIPGNAPIDVFRTAIKETLAGTM